MGDLLPPKILFERGKSEIGDQKEHKMGPSSGQQRKRQRQKRLTCTVLTALAWSLLSQTMTMSSK